MAQIKVTLTIESVLMRDVHAAIDAADAHLRKTGGRIISGKLKPDAKTVTADAATAQLAYDAKPEAPPMRQWIALYTRIPTNYNTQHKLIVEAPDETTAYRLCRRHIGDEGKEFATYSIDSVKPHNPMVLAGRVIGGV